MHYDDRLLLHAPEALPFESGVERLETGLVQPCLWPRRRPVYVLALSHGDPFGRPRLHG